MDHSSVFRILSADVTLLYDPEFYDRARRAVPEYRRRKADRYRFMKDRALSLGAGLLLKKACADRGIPGADEYVEYGEYEKPSLSGHPEFHFSLSHSGTAVLCVTAPVSVGCDVEEVRDCDLALAARFFHPEEYASLLNCPEEERPERFFQLWTLKESYIKCTGSGLSRSLSDFCVLKKDYEHYIMSTTQNRNRRLPFRLQQWFSNGYSFALCLESSIFTPNISGISDIPDSPNFSAVDLRTLL